MHAPPLRAASLEQALMFARSASPHFVVRGPRGFGKTGLLRDFTSLVRTSPQPSLDVPAVRTAVLSARAFTTSPTVSVTQSFRRMLEALYDAVGEDVGRARKLPWDHRTATQVFRDGLEMLLEDAPESLLLVAFDGIDDLRGSGNSVEVFDTLRMLGENSYEAPFDRLRLVVSTSIPLIELGDALSSLNHWPEVALAPYTEDDVACVISPTGAAPLPSDLLRGLQQEFRGHPKLIELALAETQSVGEALPPWAARITTSPSVNAWFAEVWPAAQRGAGAVQAMLRGELITEAQAQRLLNVGLVTRAPEQRAGGLLRVTPIGDALRRWMLHQGS